MPSPGMPRPMLEASSKQIIVAGTLIVALATLPWLIPSLSGANVRTSSESSRVLPPQPAASPGIVSDKKSYEQEKRNKPKLDGKWRGDMSVRDSGITVVLLSFKRPDHVKEIVRTYLEMPEELIRDIYIFNNDDVGFRELFDPSVGGSPRVTVLDAHANLGIGNSRFFVGTLARTRAVLTQDDDLILTRQGVEKLYEHWRQEPDRVHGAYSRGPTLLEPRQGKHRDASEPKAVLSADDASPLEDRMARKVQYEMLTHHLTPGQLRRQSGRVEEIHRAAAGAPRAWVGGSAWNAPKLPLRRAGMSDEEDRATACPILITRVVMFDRERAYQYFRWVLEMQDTIPKQKPFGHGEDLLLSLLSVRESGGKLNRAWRDVANEITELPQLRVGVSTVHGDHLQFRSMFLQLACDRLELPCWDWIMLDKPKVGRRAKPSSLPTATGRGGSGARR